MGFALADACGWSWSKCRWAAIRLHCNRKVQALVVCDHPAAPRVSSRPKNLQGDYRPKLMKRLKRRNRDYMKLPDGMIRLWYNLLCRFVDWYIKSGRSSDPNIIGNNQDSLGMGTVWQMYIDAHPTERDDFLQPEVEVKEHHLENEKFGADLSDEEPDDEENLAVDSAPAADAVDAKAADSAGGKPARGILVIFQGTTGIGKSHATEQLVEQMKQRGVRATGLEQDPLLSIWLAQCWSKMLGIFDNICRAGSYEVVFSFATMQPGVNNAK
eukprot:GABV01000971.1.p1 GENE.GABV01000971.1~~GABV01000971.1.p1  ORF type:complete len:270 (+),score=75.14 GABV01000971.1:181-990(+)